MTDIKDCNTKPQVAVVTGASRGIGRAIAIDLAKHGFCTVIAYHERHREAAEVAEICKSFGAQAISVRADVQCEGDVDHLFTMASQLGPPSVLINNAGIDDYGLFTDLPLVRWNAILGVNLTGAFLCSKRAMPYLRLATRSRIINIASTHGISGAACEAAYAASKGGLIALTKSLARELATSGITVNAVAPGAIETDMLKRFDNDEVEEIRERIPIGRLGRTEEVAALVRFLASAEADFITGQVISPNGGQLT